MTSKKTWSTTDLDQNVWLPSLPECEILEREGQWETGVLTVLRGRLKSSVGKMTLIVQKKAKQDLLIFRESFAGHEFLNVRLTLEREDHGEI